MVYLDFYPTAGPVAFEDGFTQFHFVVTILGIGEQGRRFPATGDVLINGPVLHLMTIRKPFSMSSGIVRKAGHIFAKSSGGPLEDLIRFIPPTDDYFIRLLDIPTHTALGSVDSQRETAFPPGGDLRNRRIRVHAVRVTMGRTAKLEQHTPKILRIDRVRYHGRRIDLSKGLHLASWASACFVKRLQVGKYGLCWGTEDEGNGVNPVRTNVADRTQFPAFRRQQTPVIIGLFEQPILKEMPVHLNDLPQVTSGDEGSHLQDRGEKSAHVINRKDRPPRARLPYRGDDLRRLSGRHAERFFAEDMLARLQAREALLDVNLIGRGNVNDVDIG